MAMLLLGITASECGSGDVICGWVFPGGLAGFLAGLFPMTAADWIFHAWEQFVLGPLLNDWVCKRLGLEPEKDGKSGV